MVLFLASLLRYVLNLFSPRESILSENPVLKKEDEILLRKVGKKGVCSSLYGRFLFVVLNRAADVEDRRTLVKPDTVLAWQRTLIRQFWTFQHRPARRSRESVDAEIKNLILTMKDENVFWGVKRIQVDLLKLDISLSTKTIRKILQSFRRHDVRNESPLRGRQPVSTQEDDRVTFPRDTGLVQHISSYR